MEKYKFKELIFLLVSQILLISSSVAKDRASLNILLICAEDMGLDINPYYDVPFETPALDRLSKMGTTFERAYTTAPSCSTSRASIFTGLMPHSHGQIGLVGRGSMIHPNIPNFASILNNAGYYLGVTYKLHFEPEPKFDLGPKNTAFGDPEKLVFITKQVIDEAQKVGKPWFMMLNTFDTHGIGKSQAKQNKNLWKHQFSDKPKNPIKANDIVFPPYLAGDPLVKGNANMRENIAGYYNAVRRVDDTVGRALRVLKSSGLLNNTIIIFTSDHGPVLPRGKQMVYQTGSRVPLIIAGPGFNAGVRSDLLISLMDLMPTILDIAAVPVPSGVQGVSILDQITQPSLRHNYVVTQFFQHWGPGGFFPSYSITNGKYSLIYNPLNKISRPWREYHGVPYFDALPNITDEVFANAWKQAVNPPIWELFNIAEDPWEFHDLSTHSSYANTLSKMKEALSEWRKRYRDPYANSKTLNRLATIHNEANDDIQGYSSEEEALRMKLMVTELQALVLK